MATKVAPHELGLGELFERVRDAVVVVATDTARIALWNPAAVALFGHAAAEAVGLTVEALSPAARRAGLRKALARYGATGRGAPTDPRAVSVFPAVHKAGAPLRIELTISPLHHATGDHRFVLAIIRDVTARARLEAERDALLATEQERLRRLGELAILKAEFTAMVAHELATPLATIGLLTEGLARGTARPGGQASALAAIRAELATLTRLVDDIRVAAHAERDDFAVRPRPIPLAVLLADGAAFARALPGAHPVETTSEPALAHALVRADPERIGQVLRNLLGNAAKYSAPAAPIALRAFGRAGRAWLQVADRGRGIHPDDLARVFEKFGRGRDDAGAGVPGVGLGLYLSRRIVQAHGGELTVESYPGVGSVFGFALEVVP